MIPLELMTMAGGGIMGFIFRYMAERAKERQQQFELLLQKEKMAEDSRNAAAQRDSSDAGKYIRRIIVILVLFGVILAPFILALLGKPTIVEINEEKATFLFGLFGGGTESRFLELPSYLLVPEVRQSLMAIIGFYFGSATASSKS